MKITVNHLQLWKKQNEKFTVLTAYDYTMAKLVSQANIPVILVGDSLGQVMLGYSTTLPVTMDEMLHHTAAVSRGAKDCLIVADMPFMSYQTSVQTAVQNAGRFIKEAGAHAVKLEGGSEMAEVVAAITRAGIPVMGHLGLRPQAINRLGSYATQAVTPDEIKQLLADAKAVEAAGAFSIVFEKIAPQAASKVTKALTIPTIGIGAGSACDGQVLVSYDLLGLFTDYVPPFVKQYANLGQTAVAAMQQFDKDVKNGCFPEKQNKVKHPRAKQGGRKQS